MTEINDSGALSRATYGTPAAAMSAREAAWSAVRGRQQAADLSGLVLAQMALELIDAAAQHRDEQSYLRDRGGRADGLTETGTGAGPGAAASASADADADTDTRTDLCEPPQLDLAGACAGACS